MDVLRELIQTIIVIVVLAVLVEMLLPNGDMRRYVKMVIGLLIIMAVLQAAAGVVNSQFMQEVPAVTVSDTGAPPLEDIMAAGEELSAINRDKAEQQYCEGLSGQVLALVNMNSEVQAVDARVNVDRENSDIKEITIVFLAGDKEPAGGAKEGLNFTDNESGALDVQPVVVELGEKTDVHEFSRVNEATPEQKKIAAELTGVIAEFYNLKPDQVKYEFQ
ncbi:Stage III sporulation protein AF [Sporotomaculum syntrophicum]|uniref:Stage III sporulation protein AF n=1 Tax=Sporotomaculum syntrophicum TaxID=182264 RepID=A0A9D2WSY2_9FIRM|nr:stage III sporulation protein AF [Sporotomaculum syntrophicum]KAF1086540.1 Stage III sporulation protein AF [Sporotomaculum syntrophicum]